MNQAPCANVSLFFIVFFNVSVLGLCRCEAFSLVAASREYCLVKVQGLLLVLASRCRPWVLGHGFKLSDCGTQAQLPRGSWNPPRPGTEPMSPSLAGGFLTTGPPGESL